MSRPAKAQTYFPLFVILTILFSFIHPLPSNAQAEEAIQEDAPQQENREFTIHATEVPNNGELLIIDPYLDDPTQTESANSAGGFEPTHQIFLPSVIVSANEQNSTEAETVSTEVTNITASAGTPTVPFDFTVYRGRVDSIVVGASETSSERSCDEFSRNVNLQLPTGSTVQVAYLYWATSGFFDSALSLNGNTVGAERSWSQSFVNGSSTLNFYGARANVTTLVGGSGSYQVNNLVYSRNNPYCNSDTVLGTWTLAVIYSNASLPLSTLTLYNGFAGQFAGTNGTTTQTIQNVTLDGFTIPTQCAANVTLTHVSQEGDAAISDRLSINGNSMGNNTYNGSAAPNLDIDSYDLSTLVAPGSQSVLFTTTNFRIGGSSGWSQELYINHVFLLKYRECPPTPTPTSIPPTNTPTHTPIPPTNTPTNTPVPSTATPTNTPVPPTNTPVPSTATPTNTPIPATNTPTNTPVPSTNTPIPQMGSIGDRVWNDLNRNGLQENGELGFAGVSVQLRSPCTSSVTIANVTSDVDGLYSFNGLSAGEYRVRITLPTGFQLSLANQGADDGADSDFSLSTTNPTLATSNCVTLGVGVDNRTVDAGISLVPSTPTNTPLPPTPTNTVALPTPTNTPSAATPTHTPVAGTGVIGDFVWNDLNRNGVQNSGEPGLAGVVVQLRSPCASSVKVRETTTDANGLYHFTGLAAGEYRIRVTLPTGFQLSPALQGLNVGLDSNFSLLSTGTQGQSDCVTLGDGQNTSTIDAGINQVP